MLRPSMYRPCLLSNLSQPISGKHLGSKHLLDIVCRAITGPETEPQVLLYTTFSWLC